MEILTPEVIEEFLVYQEGRGIGPASLEAYRRNLTKLLEFLPEGKSLTVETGRVWRAQMEMDGVTPRSVNSRLSALNSLCEYLGRREFQTRDFMREEAVLQPELTRAEDLRLLQAARTSRGAPGGAAGVYPAGEYPGGAGVPDGGGGAHRQDLRGEAPAERQRRGPGGGGEGHAPVPVEYVPGHPGDDSEQHSDSGRSGL